jgi:hypothetical protein
VNFLAQLSKDTLICSELQVKDYKEILKCTFGDAPDKIIFIETICRIFSKVANKSLEYIKQLNIIDFFCLLLDIRANSLGNCSLVLTQNKQKFNLELDLIKVKQETSSLFEQLATTIKHSNLEVCFECPSVERLMQNAKEDYLSYIKGSYITEKEKRHFTTITTNQQAEMFFDMLPPKVSLEIINNFNTFVEKITEMNYLSVYGFNEQRLVFLPSIDSLLWFAKLLFSEPLSSLYDNIFYLSYSGKMNNEYVERLSVGEYNYFVGLLSQVLASKNSPKEPEQDENFDEDPGFLEEGT